MTNAEHKLIVSMFATQMSITDSLIGLLQDKGIFKNSEYVSSQGTPDPVAFAAFLSAVRVQYVGNAKLLGLDVDLDEAS